MKDQAAAAHRPSFVILAFASSLLLFLVQPLAARMALPMLGGAPNVWNSAMLVFQALLLGGYAYAHALARLPLRRQATIHLSLLTIAALALPITLVEIPRPAPGWEVLWVPALFALTVGPVFLLVSAQAPLMQRWFVAAPGAGNPYALYAASNVGSFAGLLAYQLWLEPTMSLGQQSHFWTIGYLLLVGLIALAALSRWNVAVTVPTLRPEESAQQPTTKKVLLWLALSAVPSGLMLSTTSLLTTDLMAMPLLWIIPLGIYLLSFSLAFTDESEWTMIFTRYAPLLLLAIGSLAMISGGQANPATAIAMLGLLFVLSVALHGRLYALRPDPQHLTLFYLIIAAGGAAGGIFTALIAPVLFDWLYEHPILLLSAAVLLPMRPFAARLGKFWAAGTCRAAIAGAIVLIAAVLAWMLASASAEENGSQILALVLTMTLLGVLVIGSRLAYVTIVALIMVGHGGVATLQASRQGDRTRSYFGVYNIEDVDGGRFRQLSHGTTVHGRQWLDPFWQNRPTAYYGPDAGIGVALASARPDATIGVVGLGAGTLACYRKPGQQWTFFEIDPQVLAYSRDGTFSFLQNCTPDAQVIIGDARLELAKLPDRRFDVLAIDAFSSDSIPLHLMTTEAFGNYQRVLKDDGLLLVHISNRFIDLAPMVAALAHATGWYGRVRSDPGELGEGLSPSIWIALARTETAVAALEKEAGRTWAELPPPALRAWIDDNASILPLIRW